MKLRQRLAISYIQTKFKVLTIFSKKRAAQKMLQLFLTPLQKIVTKKDINGSKSIHFALNEKTIRGFEWNKTGNKTLLILHGFGSAAFKFEEYANLAAEKNYRVLAFDAPAHGLSDGKTTSAIEYGDAIVEIVKQFGTIDAFICHSFGGIGLCLALEKMQHTTQTKIVFIAPATETRTALNKAFEFLQIKNKDVMNEVDKLILEQTGHPTDWFSMRRILKNVQAQILWIHDEDDDITPLSDALNVKADNHTNINFVITKGLGHQRIYRDEAVKKQVQLFL